MSVPMNIIERLRKKNRALLELRVGIVFIGLVCQIVGSFIVKQQAYYAKSLWFGILMAFAASAHMYRTLDRWLDSGQDASKMIFRGYLFRYVFVIFVLAVTMMTKVMDPMIIFMGYMSLKVAAYLQPFTHKLCNKFFSETDPIPTALPEEAETVGETRASQEETSQEEILEEELLQGTPPQEESLQKEP